ncbi:hypothetical protein Tco_1233815 [Tanacetum coccineum]|uniref:Reverse transcriptase domain-containing protein n=1 Tax=Tanacetum coccineum TaxID=301880 RepID=A0ABQ5GMT7_9ASTR
MDWVVYSDAVMRSSDTVLVFVVTALRYIGDAVSSYCREILEQCWCRSAVLSVSSPITIRVFDVLRLRHYMEGNVGHLSSRLKLEEVTPWKGVIRFGKKGKLAPSSVHDTFHVSNLKKCLADANLHVPLDEIKIDKTLHFVEEPVEIIDHEVRSLKRSKISLVKVRWNSKRGPEFT